jgi:hypothetical protein
MTYTVVDIVHVGWTDSDSESSDLFRLVDVESHSQRNHDLEVTCQAGGTKSTEESRDSALSAAKDEKPSTGCLAAIVVAVTAGEPSPKERRELAARNEVQRVAFQRGKPPSLARSPARPRRTPMSLGPRIAYRAGPSCDRHRGRWSVAVSETDTETFSVAQGGSSRRRVLIFSSGKGSRARAGGVRVSAAFCPRRATLELPPSSFCHSLSSSRKRW